MLRIVITLLLGEVAALSLQPRMPGSRLLSHAHLLRMADEPAPAPEAVSDGSMPLEPEKVLAAAQAVGPAAEAGDRQSEPFDPRIIVYVSLPALVLGAQLFFTFSRDALGGDAVGPAIMDAMP
mmetsp:Transcript_50369/g.116272  ORF Transcript_50369/g.116272 Transcript_50369/m.116272 type:complete len:123 (-) Transcript_50369:290-658(-)